MMVLRRTTKPFNEPNHYFSVCKISTREVCRHSHSASWDEGTLIFDETFRFSINEKKVKSVNNGHFAWAQCHLTETRWFWTPGDRMGEVDIKTKI